MASDEGHEHVDVKMGKTMVRSTKNDTMNNKQIHFSQFIKNEC